MLIANENYYSLSKFSSFQNIAHGFSSRQMGNMSISREPSESTVNNREIFIHKLGMNSKAIVQAKLSHSCNIAIVTGREAHATSDENGLTPEVIYKFPSAHRNFDFTDDVNSGYDCIITATPGISLLILTADCAPVLIYDPVKQIVALVHVGLLGALNNIFSCAINVLRKQFHITETDLYIGIGPAILGCCYNLNLSGLWNNYLKDTFDDSFPEKRKFLTRNPDGVYINLQDLIISEALSNNVLPSKIDSANFCVACNNAFFSNFSTKGAVEKKRLGRFASVIGIKSGD